MADQQPFPTHYFSEFVIEVEWSFDQLFNMTSPTRMQIKCDQIARETPHKIELPYLLFPELSSSNELTTTQH